MDCKHFEKCEKYEKPCHRSELETEEKDCNCKC